jgi:hypothetical protein
LTTLYKDKVAVYDEELKYKDLTELNETRKKFINELKLYDPLLKIDDDSIYSIYKYIIDDLSSE